MVAQRCAISNSRVDGPNRAHGVCIVSRHADRGFEGAIDVNFVGGPDP